MQAKLVERGEVVCAKRRFYVIWNKRLWSQLPNARVIARVLGQGDGPDSESQLRL